MSRRNWKALVAEYRSSGLTQEEFAKLQGVSLSTLSRWLKMSKGQGSFVRIDADERIELELMGGIRLKVSERNLASVLKALQS